MAEHFRSLDGLYGWQQWPVEYRSPESTAVAAFAAEHPDEVEFFAYVQWLAHEQLAAAAAACAPMACGIYRDLAVGVELNGAERGRISARSSAAPRSARRPIRLTRSGRTGVCRRSRRSRCANGLRAIRPAASRQHAHAGALRIDHVMALSRSSGFRAAPRRSRAPTFAIRSTTCSRSSRANRRHRCAIVGEDLGTVPEGFRERMRDARVFSCRLLYFERTADRRISRPASYPAALATSGDARSAAARRLVDRRRLGPARGAGAVARRRLRAKLAGTLGGARGLDRRARHWRRDRSRRRGPCARTPAERPPTDLAAASPQSIASSPARSRPSSFGRRLGDIDAVNVPGTMHSTRTGGASVP